MPNFSWYFNVQETGKKDKTYNFVATVGDTGLYECKAFNEIGNASIKITLIVHSPPMIYEDADDVIKARSLDGIELNCEADGYPEVSFHIFLSII